MNKIFSRMLTFLVLASMVLAACQQAATPTAVVTQPAAAPTTAPQAQPTAGPTAAPTSFWSPQLKQAIAAAIDREAIVDTVFEGRNTPAYSMVPPG